MARLLLALLATAALPGGAKQQQHVDLGGVSAVRGQMAAIYDAQPRVTAAKSLLDFCLEKGRPVVGAEPAYGTAAAMFTLLDEIATGAKTELTVVALGGAITAGAGGIGEHRWPEMLKAALGSIFPKLKVTVRNGARPGKFVSRSVTVRLALTPPPQELGRSRPGCASTPWPRTRTSSSPSSP